MALGLRRMEKYWMDRWRSPRIMMNDLIEIEKESRLRHVVHHCTSFLCASVVDSFATSIWDIWCHVHGVSTLTQNLDVGIRKASSA